MANTPVEVQSLASALGKCQFVVDTCTPKDLHTSLPQSVSQGTKTHGGTEV